MTQLATLDDIAAVGGVTVDASADSPEGVRATRLLELASASILAFYDGFNLTEAMILGVEATDDDEAIVGWESFRLEALAAVTAEITAKRLNVSAAPSVDPYTTPMGPQTLKLNRWEKQTLRELIPVNADGELEWVQP